MNSFLSVVNISTEIKFSETLQLKEITGKVCKKFSFETTESNQDEDSTAVCSENSLLKLWLFR